MGRLLMLGLFGIAEVGVWRIIYFVCFSDRLYYSCLYFVHLFQQSETVWWVKYQKPGNLYLFQKCSAKHTRPRIAMVPGLSS